MGPPKTEIRLSPTALDGYIEQARADWNNVGVAIAVVHGSEVVYARGFGVREYGKATKVDPDTLFQIGSTTKAFTTAALGILVEEGKISWDDRIIDYLPGFTLQDPWLTRNLTIRDSVVHRSGISITPYPFLSIMNSDEAIRQLRYVSPEGRFRDSFLYNNVLYGVAGKIIEAVAGLTWNDFISCRLLHPLKMNRSGTSPYEFWDAKYVAPVIFGSAPARHVSSIRARDDNVAMPHGWDETGTVQVLSWQSYDNVAAAGTLVSSVADMGNWLIAHLNAGRFEDRQILKPDTLRELHATHNLHAGEEEFQFPVHAEGYAMGWWRTDYRGGTHLAHSGGIIGFPAYVAMLPDRSAGIVILSNGPKVANDAYRLECLFHKAIAFWVFDRLLGAPARDWNLELLNRARSVHRDVQRKEDALSRSRLANSPPSLPLNDYSGTYADESRHSGPVNVALGTGGLTLSFAGEGAYAASLEHWHRDLFRIRSRAGISDALGPQFAEFEIDPAGQVVSMSAFGAGFRRQPVTPTVPIH